MSFRILEPVMSCRSHSMQNVTSHSCNTRQKNSSCLKSVISCIRNVKSQILVSLDFWYLVLSCYCFSLPNPSVSREPWYRILRSGWNRIYRNGETVATAMSVTVRVASAENRVMCPSGSSLYPESGSSQNYTKKEETKWKLSECSGSFRNERIKWKLKFYLLMCAKFVLK